VLLLFLFACLGLYSIMAWGVEDTGRLVLGWSGWVMTGMVYYIDGRASRKDRDEYLIWITMADKTAYEAGCRTMNRSRLVRCPS
jgi:hypothetical protein